MPDGIEAEVTYKDVKHLRMRIVPPHGQVRVSVPHGTSAQAVQRFLASHREWLLRHTQAIRSADGAPSLVDGGRVRVWGTWYPLRVQSGRRARGEIRDEVVHLVSPTPTTEGTAAALDNLYRRELGPAVADLLDQWGPRVGRTASRVRLRRMTSRWGSCNHRTRAMTFNLALVEHPPAALEYVVVHEMVHLHVPGHGPEFRRWMDALLPDWGARRRALRGSA